MALTKIGIDAISGAIQTSNIQDGAVTSAKIATGGIATVDMEDGSVTSLKIANGGVATADIADGAITTDKIAAGAVATVDIADSAVTSAKIADGTIALGDLSATGTKDATTFLRGDNTFAVVAVTPTAVSDQSNSSTGYFDLPTGTTAQRPGSPSNGMARYNTDTSSLEYYGNSLWNGISTVGIPISSASFSWNYLPQVNTSGASVSFNDSNYWGAYFSVPNAGTGEVNLAGYEYPLVGKFALRSSANSDAIFQLYGFNGGSPTGFWDTDTFFQMGLVFVAPPYGSGQTNSLHATAALTAGNGVYFVGKGYGTGTWSFYNGSANSNSSTQSSTNREAAQSVTWTGQTITFVLKRDTDNTNARSIAMYFNDTQVYKWSQKIPSSQAFVSMYIGNGYGAGSNNIWNRDRPKFRYAEYSGSTILMV
jgi:hypothetical protein